VTKPVLSQRPLKRVVIVSIVAAVVLTSVAPSSAACGGYCEARQTLTACHRAVTTNNFKTHERDAEFEKCKSDLLAYRAQALEGAAQFGLE
jgi:hypothetical protein